MLKIGDKSVLKDGRAFEVAPERLGGGCSGCLLESHFDCWLFLKEGDHDGGVHRLWFKKLNPDSYRQT